MGPRYPEAVVGIGEFTSRTEAIGKVVVLLQRYEVGEDQMRAFLTEVSSVPLTTRPMDGVLLSVLRRWVTVRWWLDE